MFNRVLGWNRLTRTKLMCEFILPFVVASAVGHVLPVTLRVQQTYCLLVGMVDCIPRERPI